MHHFFIENEIVTDEKQRDIEYGIATSAGSIPECLDGHEFFEWRIEPINDIVYKSNGFVDHKGSKDNSL